MRSLTTSLPQSKHTCVKVVRKFLGEMVGVTKEAAAPRAPALHQQVQHSAWAAGKAVACWFTLMSPEEVGEVACYQMLAIKVQQLLNFMSSL